MTFERQGPAQRDRQTNNTMEGDTIGGTRRFAYATELTFFTHFWSCSCLNPSKYANMHMGVGVENGGGGQASDVPRQTQYHRPPQTNSYLPPLAKRPCAIGMTTLVNIIFFTRQLIGWSSAGSAGLV